MSVTIEQFEEIAKAKGAEFEYVEGNVTRLEQQIFHIDLDMVELSLKHAVENADNDIIKESLERLRSNGTDAQKIDFVIGEGVYYFPEDLELMASRFRGKDFQGLVDCHTICSTVCWVACQCIPNPVLKQICRTLCRPVCKIVCD